MTSLLSISDLATFTSTRESWHRVAEHVVAKARHVHDGRVELAAFEGGFATPILANGERVRVDGLDIVVDQRTESRRARLTTIAEAAEFVGVDPGFPTDLYPADTPLHLSAALPLDRGATDALAAWYSFTAEALNQFSAELLGGDPSPLVLWPEHFDQAFFTNDVDESKRANYGASPGDAGHPEPYLYVGPFVPVADHEFWNTMHFNGAVVPLSRLVVSDDPFEVAVQFFHAGRTRIMHG